jgi:hypothetical protein
MMTEERDKLSDEVADKIRTIMRDTMGIVNPNQYLRMRSHEGYRIAVVEQWPVGIDSRAADHLMVSAGIEVFRLPVLSPYVSAYKIADPPG